MPASSAARSSCRRRPRPVRMLDGRIVLRMNEADTAEALTTPIPEAAAPGGPGGGGRLPAENRAVLRHRRRRGAPRARQRQRQVAGGSNLSWQAQRVDGGTVWPSSGGNRDPKVPAGVPSATIAVEHYNRMLRILDKGLPVKVEVNIQTTFFPEAAGTLNGINTIAEIPGTRSRGRGGHPRGALRHASLCHRRHRQRDRLDGDDGSDPRDQEPGPASATDHPRRALGR